MKFVVQQLSAKPWQSPLQLILGGLLIFLIALYVGPFYGCGEGNRDLQASAFSCIDGSMSWLYKGLIVLCITLASLCWGRAASLLEKRTA